MSRRFFLSPSVILCFTDFAAILFSCCIAFFLRYTTSNSMEAAPYIATLPWLLVFPFLFAALSLYPATFMRRSEEVKRQCIAITVGFMGHGFLSFLIKESHTYSRAALLLSWLFAVFCVPLTRYIVRRYCCKLDWWSTPCIIFASGERLTALVEELLRSGRQGLKPVALILDEDDPEPEIKHLFGPADALLVGRIPLKDTERARTALEKIAARYRNAYAVISLEAEQRAKRQGWLNVIDLAFQRIIVIPDIAVGGRVWVMAVSIGRLSGIMLRQNLLDPRRMLLKRGIDLVFTFVSGIFLFPALFLLAIVVRLDSAGPALFAHTRIGRNGKHFKVYKFRTMAKDGDAILAKHLAANPEARTEWEETQKLKEDPRVTRVGKFLRKTSLDELPQILNVLSGDMSLVGPRPIVDSEVAKYGEDFALYIRVRPGITGLWQVSGRNNVSYDERVRLDHYYVCNWSVWLDLLIIVRTVPEVLHCSGAY